MFENLQTQSAISSARPSGKAVSHDPRLGKQAPLCWATRRCCVAAGLFGLLPVRIPGQRLPMRVLGPLPQFVFVVVGHLLTDPLQVGVAGFESLLPPLRAGRIHKGGDTDQYGEHRVRGGQEKVGTGPSCCFFIGDPLRRNGTQSLLRDINFCTSLLLNS